MFQFAGFASHAYEFSMGYRLRGGLPHSEIHGSKPARGSPWLIATCCVLHRLSVPRHPPDALQTLDPHSAVAPRAGASPDARTTPQDALTIEPTPCRAGPRSVLGHLTIVFTLSMIPLQSSPLEESRSSRFRVAFPSDGSLPEHPFPTPGPRHQKTGGGRRDRTDDLLLAKQALSQLSYAPMSV